MKITDKKFQKGFTLVEVLVALMILGVAMTPIVFLATSAITTADSIRDNVIAANLAQEGIEVIRAIRDTNWTAVPSRSFDNGLSAGDYAVVWNAAAPLPFNDTYLKFDSATGLYRYTVGVPTTFKRKITISKPSNVEIQVLSSVTWRNQTGSKSFQLEDHLFDWRY